MHRISVLFFMGTAWILGLACSPNPQDKNMPKRPFDLTHADNPEISKQRQEKWENLMRGLGMEVTPIVEAADDEGKAQLIDQLSTPSRLLTDEKRLNEYMGWLDRAIAEFTRNPEATQCAAVTGYRWIDRAQIPKRGGGMNDVQDYLDPETERPVAQVYQLSYRLVDKEGLPEARERHALLSLPLRSEPSPILVYSHGGDRGLSFLEPAFMIGPMQRDHVVLAPTFPDEPFCRRWSAQNSDGTLGCDEMGTIAVESGVSKPWSNDVDELIGVHNCLRRMIDENDKTFPAPELLRSAMRRKVKRITSFGGPQTIIWGASRGGLVAALALAKAGAMLSAAVSDAGGDQKKKIEALSPKFSCAAIVSAPSSVLFGGFRIVLELLVKNQLVHSRYIGLPGLRRIKDLFNDYLNDSTGSKALYEAAIMDIFKRDSVLLSPLVVAGLRDWENFYDIDSKVTSDSTNTHLLFPSGAIGFFHGQKDQVVPPEQMIYAFNSLFTFAHKPLVLLRTRSRAFGDYSSSRLNGVPYLGLRPFMRAFAPPPGTDESAYQHLDGVFRDSSSVIPFAYVKNREFAFRRHVEDEAKEVRKMRTESNWEASQDSTLEDLLRELHEAVVALGPTSASLQQEIDVVEHSLAADRKDSQKIAANVLADYGAKLAEKSIAALALARSTPVNKDDFKSIDERIRKYAAERQARAADINTLEQIIKELWARATLDDYLSNQYGGQQSKNALYFDEDDKRRAIGRIFRAAGPRRPREETIPKARVAPNGDIFDEPDVKGATVTPEEVIQTWRTHHCRL